MRKTFKILLLAVMLLVMVGMTMMVASAAEGTTVEKPYEVLTGESTHGTFATFAEAIAAVKSNQADTIKLLDNVTLTNRIDIDTPVTIDGQGHTFTFAENVKGSSGSIKAVTVKTNGDVTFKEITVHVTATTNVWAFEQAGTGTLTFYNAKVTGSKHTIGHTAAGRILIDGPDSALGYGNSSNTWVVMAPGTLEIRNGKIDTTDGGSDMFWFDKAGQGAHFKMSGGAIRSGGDALYSQYGYNITVTGGTIYAKGNAVNPGGSGTVANLSNCTIESGKGYSAINCRGTGTEFTLTNVTLTGLMNTSGGGKMTIVSGTYTAHAGSYLFNWNNSGSTLHIKGGTFTAPGDTTATLLRISDGGATVIIDGGQFTVNRTSTGSDISVVEKNNGKLTINGGTFTANGQVRALTVSQNSGGSYTTINGGTFTGVCKAQYEGLAAVYLGEANTESFTINDCVMHLQKGSTSHLMSIYLNGNNITVNINGGQFITESYVYGVRLYDESENGRNGNINISGGFFSYVPYDKVYNSNGTMKENLSGLVNASGNEGCNAVIFTNCASTITISGGVFYGGPGSKVFRLNRAENLVFDGDAELYAWKITDITMSSGKVCITVYDVKTNTIPGQNNRADFCNLGNPYDGKDEAKAAAWKENVVKNSFVKIYGGTFAPYRGSGDWGAFILSQPIQVFIGGTYEKGGQTYTADVTMQTGKQWGGNATAGHLVRINAETPTVTVGAGAHLISDNSGFVMKPYSADAKMIFAAGCVVEKVGNNIIEMTVASHIIINEGAKITSTQNGAGFWMSAGTLTMNGGTLLTRGAAIRATGGTVTLNGGMVGFLSSSGYLDFNGSCNVTINDGFFMTYLDNITGPEAIDPNASEIPVRDGIPGVTDYDTHKNYDEVRSCYGAQFTTSGTVIINGGIFHAGNSNAAATFACTATINGGTFYGYRAIMLNAGANVTVVNGNFYGNPGQTNVHLVTLDGAGAKLTVNGGTFDITHNQANASNAGGGLFVINNENVTLNINGGTFIGRANGVQAEVALINIKNKVTTTKDDVTTTTIYDGISVNITAGTFTATSDKYPLFRIASPVKDEESDVYKQFITVAGGTYTIQAGALITADLRGITFVATDANNGQREITFIIGEGCVIPTPEDLQGYDDHFFKAKWVVNSWDSFEFAGQMTITTMQDLANACQAYIEDVISGICREIDAEDNLVVDVQAWVPVYVVEGGELTLDMQESVSVLDTLVTVKGGTVIVLGGNYTGVDFGTANGLFNVESGTLTIENGSFTMTNGGSIVYMTGSADVTIKGGTFLIDASGAKYYNGSIVRVGTDNKNITGNISLEGGNFTATRIITIYAINADDEGNATTGVSVSVTGGTYTGNAASGVDSSSRYMFQIARAGNHTIDISGVKITSTEYGVICNMNASANGGAINLTNVTVEGGTAWLATNKANTSYTVTDSTFTDTTGKMVGIWSGEVVLLAAKNAFMSFTGVTFEVNSNVTFLHFKDGGSVADDSSNITFDNVTVKTNIFTQETSATVVLDVIDLLLYVNGTDSVIFDCLNTQIEKAVVIAANAEFVKSGVAFGAVQVKKGGVLHSAFVKNPATSESYFASQQVGAAIDVSVVDAKNNPDFGGIRFLFTISDDMANKLKAISGATFTFGTVIAPADYVAAAGEFTMEALDKLNVNGVKYVDIPAVDTFSDGNGDGIPESFSGALISLNNYERAYAGVSYIKVTVGGVTTTYYGAFDTTENARSAQQIAQEIIDNPNSAYYDKDPLMVWGDAEKAVVDMYAGKAAE